MSVKEVSTGYVPRPLQLELHKAVQRFKVIICHRRFGKTHYALNELIDRGLRNPLRNPQYAYLAPTYGQAKRVAWDLLKDYLRNIPGIIINEADLRIDIPRPSQGDRVRFMLLGAENPGSLKGLYLDGVVLDEYAEMNPQVWSEVVRPALTDRHTLDPSQGWAIFIGTPKGQNHFYEIYQRAKESPEWFTAIYKASETNIIPRAELDAARAEMSDAEYEQEFECSFSAALIGAYYGKEMEKAEQEGRICSVPYDPLLPVTTYWDLGIDDTTVIWFVQNLGGRELRWIDYHEESGQGLPYYAKLLKEKGYVYDEHVLPHDGAVRELGTGKSRMETLQALCKGTRVRVAPRQEVADGINAARLMLAKSWFDKDKCKNGITSLKNYERVWDAKNKVFQARPKHNWASHGADAFRTGAMAMDENRAARRERDKRKRFTDSAFSVV